MCTEEKYRPWINGSKETKQQRLIRSRSLLQPEGLNRSLFNSY